MKKSIEKDETVKKNERVFTRINMEDLNFILYGAATNIGIFLVTNFLPWSLMYFTLSKTQYWEVILLIL